MTRESILAICREIAMEVTKAQMKAERIDNPTNLTKFGVQTFFTQYSNAIDEFSQNYTEHAITKKEDDYDKNYNPFEEDDFIEEDIEKYTHNL